MVLWAHLAIGVTMRHHQIDHRIDVTPKETYTHSKETYTHHRIDHRIDVTPSDGHHRMVSIRWCDGAHVLIRSSDHVRDVTPSDGVKSWCCADLTSSDHALCRDVWLPCNTLQHTATTPQHATLQHTSATHVQHTCNTRATHVQHTCNTPESNNDGIGGQVVAECRDIARDTLPLRTHTIQP